jgi:hypothetical protein
MITDKERNQKHKSSNQKPCFREVSMNSKIPNSNSSKSKNRNTTALWQKVNYSDIFERSNTSVNL